MGGLGKPSKLKASAPVASRGHSKIAILNHLNSNSFSKGAMYFDIHYNYLNWVSPSLEHCRLSSLGPNWLEEPRRNTPILRHAQEKQEAIHKNAFPKSCGPYGLS